MSLPQQILSSEEVLKKYGLSLYEKTVFITGVSDTSIAGELAVQLSIANPALLILSAKAQRHVEPIVKKIKSLNPNIKTRFLEMDLSNLAFVRKAAKSLEDVPTIDHLVAVAGVMAPPYNKTADGVESQFGINYLANFLLVKLLLPKIPAAAPFASIIIVASSAVRQGRVNFDDVNYSDGQTYDPGVAYGQSNAARVIFARSLGVKLKSKKIRVYSVDPGAVKTGLQRHRSADFVERIDNMRMAHQKLTDLDGRKYDLPPWTTRSEGAATIITGMLDPDITGYSGSFLHNNAVADEELHSHILSQENSVKLWELSEKFIREVFDL